MKKETNAKVGVFVCMIILLFAISLKCNGQHRVQNFQLNASTGHWQAVGGVYLSPDSLTVIHAYKWKREKIIAIQDYHLVNGKWVKYGSVYPVPDTLKLVHAFIR